MKHGKNYIGGNKVSATGKAFTSENPATGEAIWQGFESTEDEVNQAFDVAQNAYLKWRRLSHDQRAQHLRAYSALVEGTKDKLAEVISFGSDAGVLGPVSAAFVRATSRRGRRSSDCGHRIVE